MILPKVLVSVLNWNQPSKTIKCIQSLQTLSYQNIEIIVVDNASTDDSVEQIRHAVPSVRLICSDENLGYAGGNQLALKVALEDDTIDLFWILNNDAQVFPDTLTYLIEAYQMFGQSLYGGIPVYETEQGYKLHIRIWKNRKRQVIRDTLYDDYFDKTDARPVEALSGSHLLLPTALVRQYGYIDTSYFLYSEDTDYCFRLAQEGVPIIEVPRSIILHQGGGSQETGKTQSIKPIIKYYQTRNRIVLFRRYFGWTGFAIEILRQALFTLAWTAYSLKVGKVGYQVAWYMILGISDSIRNKTGKIHAPEDVVEHSFPSMPE